MEKNSASSPVLGLIIILHVSVDLETNAKEVGAFPH